MSSALGRRWKAELERDRARTSATPTFSEVRPALSSEALADMEDDSLDNSDEAQQNQNQTLDVKYLSGLVSGSDAEDEAESDDEEEFANEPEAEEQEAAREGLPESVVRDDVEIAAVLIAAVDVDVIVVCCLRCHCLTCHTRGAKTACAVSNGVTVVSNGVTVASRF